MIKPSSEFDKNPPGTDSSDRSQSPDCQRDARHQELSTEQRRKKFETALADTIEKYDWALRKLAE